MRSRLHGGRLRGRPLTAGLGVVPALVLAVVLTACGASHLASTSTSSSQPPLGYRSLPSFLPTAAAVDRVVTASAAHPQLAVQGVGVQVDLPSGQVLATVTGPHVPPFVSPPPPAVTATFDISMARASGGVPLRLEDFTIIDQLGRTFRPTLVARAAPPPATVNGSVTFQVAAVMPTGEGRLNWSPTHGAPLVSWDFVVEND